MKKARHWLLVSWTAALFVLLELQSTEAALPFKKVSIGTSTPSTTATAGSEDEAAPSAPEESPVTETRENKAENTSTKNSKLTGIPQIDYIWDPNLPRELRGYNLSSYPFLSTVPVEEDIHFKCDGLHDGFYASIEHKCQVYHHCVYGIRHDFLCANFTAFDQKTFICHFVSDVDCAGSQRYWNRNDELYMATTTTSTTTTTTEPPPTQRSRRPARPQRPLRRPYNRRPIDDYYYDEEEEDDDYYVERYNRRRKPRPKQRKPIADYEDDYDDKRGFDEDDEVDKPRPNNRFRDDDDQVDDYDSDRRMNRPKGRQGKPTAVADKRKTGSGRKPGRADERRSFNDDRQPVSRREKIKPSTIDDTSVESAVDSNPRRLAGRRRINEKRTTPSTAAALDDLDDYERPHAADQEEAAEEEAPQKVKTTPKPLEEFITPKAAPASVYSRPRAPPRIARPVPINEKKKYQYPVQKATATTPNPQGAVDGDDDDYYVQPQEDEYEDTRTRNSGRRRTVGSEDESNTPVRRRNNNEAVNNSRKPTRSTLRKPVTDKKALVEEDDYDNDRYETSRGTSNRRRPLTSRSRPALRGGDDVDFVDDDYEERPAARSATSRGRTKPTARKSITRTRQPVEEHDDDVQEPLEPERPQRGRISQQVNQPRRNKPVLQSRTRAAQTKTTPAPVDVTQEEEDEPESTAELDPEQEDDSVVPAAPSKTLSSRPASVRVVKRPFLPSRGGSPYLPRGLQPVGIALKPLFDTRTTDSTPIDMGSTISGVRLLEHGPPILRNEGNDDDARSNERNAPSIISAVQGSRTTLPPRSAIPVSNQIRSEPQPKANLDELYENDYDVTLNDALDPTLKPLTPQHQHYNRNYASAYAPASSSNSAALKPFAHSNQSPVQPHFHQPAQHTQHLQSQPQAYQPQTHHYQSSASAQSSQQQNYNSDSYFSSTDIRRRAIVPAQASRSSRTDYRGIGGIGSRIAQHFYDDFEY